MPQQEPDRTIPHNLRMMAVGQIAPGLIHDANNALAVVVWNLERSSRTLSADSKEAASAKTAINSAMKAAFLMQRVLEYAGHGIYDPELVNLEEMLTHLLDTASAAISGDVTVDCQSAGGVGPVIIDETLLELGLLDLVSTLSRHMVKGSIALRAADAPDARILLTLSCAGVPAEAWPSLDGTLLQHFSNQAGGTLTQSPVKDGRCEIQLLLPRAVPTSSDGTVFV